MLFLGIHRLAALDDGIDLRVEVGVLLGELHDRVIHDDEELGRLDRADRSHAHFRFVTEDGHFAYRLAGSDVSENGTAGGPLLIYLERPRLHYVHRDGVIPFGEEEFAGFEKAFLAEHREGFPFGGRQFGEQADVFEHNHKIEE